MSQLILMRQRIASIETIKKITHAMQLISMSAHSRLRNNKNIIQQYQQAIHQVACSLKHHHDQSSHIEDNKPQPTQKLIIVVGSQKGLCGNFNAALFRFFQKHEQIDANTKLYIIGKMAVEYFAGQNIAPDLAYTNFTTSNYVELANTLTQGIIAQQDDLKQVVMYHLYQRSFFIQEPQRITLLPLEQTQNTEGKPCSATPTDYVWEDDPEVILDFIQELNLQATILEALFASQISEQAARFISMENATRNASRLLEDMKLDYNKTRQAKITLELTDLIAGIQS